MTATRLLKLPGICLLFLLVDLVSSWTLWGFNRINYTALEQCIVGAPFFITGRDLDANHRDVPHVQFTSSISSHVVDGPCSYYGLEKTTLRCDIPYSKQWDYDAWYSVKVFENDVWGTPITPGIHVTTYNSSGPKIDSVSVTCHPYGCDERVTLSIVGSSLLDNNSLTSVSLVSVFVGGPFSIDCRADFERSNANVLYCDPPIQPTYYWDISQMVKVSNKYGSCAIAGGNMAWSYTWRHHSNNSSHRWSMTDTYEPPRPDAGTSRTREPWSDLCISFVFVVALVIAWKESQRQPDQKNDMSENDVLILPESYVVMKSQHVCSSGLIETVASSESALGALNQQEAYPSLYVHCPQQATDVSPDPAFVYQTHYYQAPHYQASTDAQHQVIFSSCTIPA